MTSLAIVSFRRFKSAVGEALRDAGSAVRIARGRTERVHGDAPRILVIDEMLPEPRFGAGYPRAAELLRAIVDAGWEVTVYPMIAAPEDYPAVRNRFPRGVTLLRGRGERGLARLMRESVGAFDAVLVSRAPVMAGFTRALAALPGFAASTYCIYDAEATFTEREARRRALFAVPMSAREYDQALDAEVAPVREVRAVLSVTEAEARLFRARASAAVHVIGHTTEVRADPPGFADRTDLLFVGRSTGARDSSPNVDSMIWFVEEVMPLLDARLGDSYRLVIAGRADDALIARLASSRVVFEGVVDDLAALYDRSRVFVAPTRFAAGMPLKVIEAAAAGVPCVVTDLLAGQLDLQDGVDCMAAADAETFAAGCAALYTDRALWSRVQRAALARIGADYSRATFAAAVRRLLDDSLASRRGVAVPPSIATGTAPP